MRTKKNQHRINIFWSINVDCVEYHSHVYNKREIKTDGFSHCYILFGKSPLLILVIKILFCGNRVRRIHHRIFLIN